LAHLVYDGECPFCSAYVRMFRLREALGTFEHVDARTNPDWVRKLEALGFDLDDGMVLELNGEYYHGAEALNVLALMGSRSSAFNKLNAFLFRSRTVSRVAYPFLRAGRNAALFLLGRSRIADGANRETR
jgi:predicted DCC family thiol-disulfide oxidoreductase YuxK